MGTPSNSTSFTEATQEAFRFLQEQTGLPSWSVARVVGNQWVVLCTNGRSSLVQPHSVYPWNETLCSRMVAQERSCAIPNLEVDSAFSDTPFQEATSASAYLGVPLYHSEGELFGTLCGLDTESQAQTLVNETSQVEITARLLESVLEEELREGRESRRIEREAARACRDLETGLYASPSWDMLLAAEEDRCHRLGHTAVVGSIKLMLPQDLPAEEHAERLEELCRTAGRTLRRYTRKTDVVARVGIDEFLLLAVECDRIGIELLRERLYRAMSYAGLDVAIGLCFREPQRTLLKTQYQAVEEMHSASQNTVGYTV